MGLVNVEDATREFSKKLEEGYFSSMREDAHKLAKAFEPDEDYDERKAERDTKAVIEFANSEEFQEIVKSL